MPVEEDEFAQLYNYAVRLLARREYARKELQAKLVGKGIANAGTAQQVLDKLVQQNYQNDARFAQAFVRYKSARGFGPERIVRDLTERGVAADTIAQAFDLAAEAPLDWQRTIETVWQKKFNQPAASYQEKAKQMRFLLYRGFSHEQIHSLFARLDSLPR